MATRNTIRGVASKAIKSVAEGDRVSAEQYADIMAFMRGKQQITVRARVGVRAQGWAPGEEVVGTADVITLPVGGIARLHRTEGPLQDASVLAHMVAKGRIDVVDDKEFNKAPSHADVEAELNKEIARRNDAVQSGGFQAHLAGMRARIEDLEAKLAAAG